MKQKQQLKEAIIAEYLAGEITYRKLGEKYGVDFSMIHLWVMRYQGKMKIPKPAIPEQLESKLPIEVKQLQAELRKAQLHNKLLNAMIDIAEEQLKIDIRKKSGTKQ